MSSHNRGTKRIDQDKYYTPEWCVDALLNQLNTERMQHLSFFEPAKGSGVIYNKVPALYKDYSEIDEGKDYFNIQVKPQMIITNPPYSMAQQFIDKSRTEALFISYLLRVNFLGGQHRKEWWQGKEPTHLYVLSKRPSFVDVCSAKGCGEKYEKGAVEYCLKCGNKVRSATDSTEYAWFTWDALNLCTRKPGIYVI